MARPLNHVGITKEKSMQPSQVLIILLLVANLLATFWFGISKDTGQTNPVNSQSMLQELPAIISPEIRNQILEDFISKFNNRDFDGLYNMLGPGARAQFTRESSDEVFKKLVTYFHSAQSGAYTHSEYAGSQGDARQFVLNYAVKLDKNSTFGQSGKLKVTIVIRGPEYEIYGVHLTAETTQG
jgi:hypothetical protein